MTRTFSQIRSLLPFGTAIFLLALALWLLVFPQFPLTRLKLQRMHAENEAAAAEINATVARNKLAFEKLAGYRAIQLGAMTQPEQTAMVSFREHIEAAATAAGLRGRTIGNIRSVIVEEKVLLFDVAFSASGTLSEVVAFMKSLESASPKLYWRSISIQPDHDAFLALSGTLCTLSFANNAPAASPVEPPAEVKPDVPATEKAEKK